MFLIFLFDLVVKISKFLSNQYTFIWPYLHKSWFDHRFDYARGPQNYYWMERVVYVMREIKRGYRVLDIGCGDGMFDGLFYSQVSKKVDAIDIDSKAISFAKEKYSPKNVHYYNSDTVPWLSKGNKYDLIIMFVVIYHFDEVTGQEVLKLVKKSLKDNGILYGSTPILKSRNLYNSEHKNIFLSERQLKDFLSKVFDKVTIFTSQWPGGRKECYFECSK